LDFQRNMRDFVISRLSGTSELDETTERRRPSEYYILGNLAPLPKKGDPSTKRVTSIRATRMSLSFLTKSNKLDKSAVEVLVSFHVFYRVKDGRRRYWKRSDQFTSPITLELFDETEHELDLSRLCELINSDESVATELGESPWSIMIRATNNRYDDETKIISIGLRNARRETRDHELAIFNVQLQIKLHNVDIAEFCDEYQYEDFRQR